MIKEVPDWDDLRQGLRRLIEESIERLRFSIIAPRSDAFLHVAGTPPPTRDVVEAEQLLMAVAEIFGPRTARTDDELCCPVCGRPSGHSDLHDMVAEFNRVYDCYTQSSPGLPTAEAIEAGDLVEIADALGDLLYVTAGAGHAFGLMRDVVTEIHRSNLSKLGPDGRPVMRDDGKVLKGPNFTPPDIGSILSRSTTPAAPMEEEAAQPAQQTGRASCLTKQRPGDCESPGRSSPTE